MKEQNYAPDFSFIDSSFDDIKDFKMEPTGSYTLIRVNDGMIECALVNKDHEIAQGKKRSYLSSGR